MANDSSKVRVAVTGSLYADKTGAGAAPTSSSSALVADYKDLGFISEAGVTLTLPDSGESSSIKAWQNGATVRTVRTLSEDVPQLQFTLIETKLEVIEFAFGVTVTQAVADGNFEFDQTDVRPHVRNVLDVVDGAELIRVYAPFSIVSALGEIPLTNTDEIGYNITLDMDRDSTAGFNFKTWMTALKS